MMQINIFDKYMGFNVIYMPSKNVTLNVDEELYDRYSEFCKKERLDNIQGVLDQDGITDGRRI